MDWQPIETAPRDGGVLVTGGELRVPVCAIWWDAKNSWVLAFEAKSDAGHEIRFSAIVFPTHWAPLPEGPK